MPRRGRPRRAVLLTVAVVVALGLAAVLPTSGAVRPNLRLGATLSGAVGRGTGEWEYQLENRGWTTAQVESFDPGVPAVTITEVTFLPNHAAAPGTTSAGTIGAQDSIRVHLRFTYDCASVPTAAYGSQAARDAGPLVALTPPPSGQAASVQARGPLPVTTTVPLGSDTPGGLSHLVSILGAACGAER